MLNSVSCAASGGGWRVGGVGPVDAQPPSVARAAAAADQPLPALRGARRDGVPALPRPPIRRVGN